MRVGVGAFFADVLVIIVFLLASWKVAEIFIWACSHVSVRLL